MNNSQKILKMLSGFIETGILTSKDLKKEIMTNLDFKKEDIINKLDLVKREEVVVLKKIIEKQQKEINLLKNTSTILALGKIAYDACINYYKQLYDIRNKDYIFSHGSKNKLPDNKVLIGSYHPSPRNVNTGRINKIKMVRLLRKVKKDLDS